MNNSMIITANDFQAYETDTIEPYRPRPRFDIDNRGVWWINVRTDREGNPVEAEPLKLSDPIDIIGIGQDAGGAYYRVIRWQDKISRQTKTAVIPQSEIGSNQGFQYLQRIGITVMSGKAKREKLADYLQTEGSHTAYTVTDRAGWHGNSYILPSGEHIAGDGTESPVIYNGDTSQAAAYRTGGTLDEWRENIARYAAGNSRLCLALGASFAAPLLSLLNQESGGFHFTSNSSVGKTTILTAALSVWGYSVNPRSWNTTANALENTCSRHNDGLLVLDEIGQVEDKRQIAKMVYAIANGRSKEANRKDGSSRPVKTWRVMALSTGEVTPEQAIMEAEVKGGRWNAGNEVRLPSIPAAARYGIYDTLHGFENGVELSNYIKQAAAKHYGEAGRAFIKQLQADPDTIKAQAKAIIARFIATLPSNAEGQARRIAERYALAAAALELAAPVTGLAAGVGEAGIKQCWLEWLAANGAGNREDRAIIERATDFIDLHAWGMRFVDWNDTHTNKDHAGYRKQEGDDLELWVVSPVFKGEIAQGTPLSKVCRVLVDNGLLKPKSEGSGDRWQHQRKGGGRFYVIRAEMSVSDDPND